MAPSKINTQSKQLAAALKEEFGEKGNESEKINLGDTAGLKRALTDAVIEVYRSRLYYNVWYNPNVPPLV